MSLLVNLMNLSNVIDEETKELFGQFCLAALHSDNTNHFVKRALRRALEPDEPEKSTMVDATVVSVNPNVEPNQRPKRARTRRK